jgi:2-aminoethylphosphonate-pyruvate transaminase
MGVRLGRLGELIPKGYICLGETPIIEESIQRLLSVGISRIVVVTGHHAEKFAQLNTLYPSVVQLVHNPHFADSGSMYSLHCARRLVEGPFLLLESDILYERRALTICLEHPADQVVLLGGFSRSSDEVFVETREDNLVAMSKDRESLGREVRGELVGISKISTTLLKAMLERSSSRFRTTLHMDYEVECLVEAADLLQVPCHLVQDLIWCEIDDRFHLARARSEVYPRLQQSEQTAACLTSRG